MFQVLVEGRHLNYSILVRNIKIIFSEYIQYGGTALLLLHKIMSLCLVVSIISKKSFASLMV